MRDHELELIAALVEGRLEDESEARALIDSSPEFREEYEAQKVAFEALRSSGSASLTETERAALHRDVWTELRAGAEPTGRRTPWYYRWMSVAAGLFVVVGLVAVVTQVGGGGDDSAEPANLAADSPEELTTSTAAATEGTARPSADEEAEAMDDSDTGTTIAADGGGSEAGDGADTDAGVALYAAEANNARERDFSGTNLQAYEDVTRSSAVDSCLAQLGIADYEIVATFTTPPDEATSTTAAEAERLLVAVPGESEPGESEPGDTPVAFIDPATCELVYLDG